MTTQDIAHIKKAVEEKKVVIGTEHTMKMLKTDLLKIVYLAKNCPERVKQDALHYAQFTGVKIVQLDQPNDELGALCRKQFSVAMVSIKN